MTSLKTSNENLMDASEEKGMPSYNDVLDKIIWLTRGGAYPTPNAFGDAVGLTETEKTKLYRSLKRKHVPKADTFLGWLDKLGAKIIFPDEMDATASRSLSFAPPQIISAEGGPPPASETYLAVPVVKGQHAANRGVIHEKAIRGWVLVDQKAEAVQFRKNLVAVEVAQDSMTPTLFAGDLVVVDRDDYKGGWKHPGNVFLCREPKASEAVMRRVMVRQDEEGTRISFLNDNSLEFEPKVFSLEKDYGGEIGSAIIGRVVWSWSDMSRR